MTDLKEVTERLLLIRKFGRERRMETRQTEIAVLSKFSPEDQGEIMCSVQRAEAALLNPLSGGKR